MLLMPLSRQLVSRLIHTHSQASIMYATNIHGQSQLQMATSWSNSPHVRHAGTFTLHTQKCLRWLETSVPHSSPLLNPD